ncbi:MAG: hypothetical protein SFZ23_12640 [Planctomycetota bacterium]|nr:hypothetical protein [Planctomycetota bacterium]
MLVKLAQSARALPPRTLLAWMEQFESLVSDLTPDGVYPEDFVVFRTTRTRGAGAIAGPASVSPKPNPGPKPNPSQIQPEAPPAGELVSGEALIPGAALLRDASAFVERLGSLARLTRAQMLALASGEPSWAGGGSLELVDDAELAARWSVSPKTLMRYRRLGLVARRALDDHGRESLVYALVRAEEFRARHAPRVARAGAFSRMDPALRARIIRRAARYRSRLGWSLNQAASRLAKRFERSQEGIRQVLINHDARAQEPIFARTPPLDERRQRVIARASRRGIEPTLLARRYRKSPPAIQRAVNIQSLRTLVRLSACGALDGVEDEGFTKPEGESLLRLAPVRQGLEMPLCVDLLGLVELARSPDPPLGVEEAARAQAYHCLKARAKLAIYALDASNPATGAIDAIRTSLLHAARLKAALVRAELRLIVDTLEGRLGRALDELPAEFVARVLFGAIAVAGGVVESFEPVKRPSRILGVAARGREPVRPLASPGRVVTTRLAAPVGLAVDRYAGGVARELSESVRRGRAASRLLPGFPVPDWTRAVCPWQDEVEPDRRLRAALPVVDTDLRRVLELRFGWTQGPPLTVAELAAELGISHLRCLRLVREAVRAGLAAARRQA